MSGLKKAVFKQAAPASVTKTSLIWLRSRSPLYSRLFLSVIREIALYISDLPLIVCVDGKAIHRLRIGLQDWTSADLNLPITVSNESRYASIDSERVFVCGGGKLNSMWKWPAWSCAYIVKTSGEVEVLRDMREARSNHGVIFYGNSVFVCGGRNLSVIRRSCEQFLLTERRWENFSQMVVPRTNVSLCEWRKEIFAVGGGLTSVEVLSVAARSFQVLPFTLPDSNFAVLFALQNSLIALSSKYKTEIKFDGRELQRDSQQRRGSQLSGGMVAVYGETLLVAMGGECLGVNIATGEEREFARLRSAVRT